MISGVLVIDKPGGRASLLTSHDVVQRVRWLSGTRKVGHAGTLDPLASGVLVLCLGRATRLVEYLVGQPKVYQATIRLGQSTDTYDAQGEIVRERPYATAAATLEEALPQFRGSIRQQPPMYSAIKREGQPLYKLARQGIEVERPWREVTITSLILLRVDLPFIEIEVRCSSGTYIRSLAHDLGEVLGCGGHITGLRRTAVGELDLETAVPLDDLSADNISAYLQPPQVAVRHLPALAVRAEEAQQLRFGQPILRRPSDPMAELVYAVDAGQFVGMLRHQSGEWWPHKIFPPGMEA
jgi:tRNA pseudouridine55 synthase